MKNKDFWETATEVAMVILAMAEAFIVIYIFH